MRSLRHSRLALTFAAILATVAVWGLLPSSDATARPVRHADSLATLRAENQQLRADLAAYQDAYDELADGLKGVEHVTKSLRDRRMLRKIQREIKDARRSAAKHLRDRREVAPTIEAIADRDLQKIVARVAAASFASDQLEVVTAAAPLNYFTVDQVVALMKACTFEDTKIDVAALLYSRLVDPNNWYLVYDGFTYSSSKKTLRERIGQ